MKLFLSGEGPDELGDWYRLPQHRSNPPVRGILEALVHKLGPVRGEVQNVLGLMVEAEEAGADVLVFVRDQDGYEDRQDDIEEGLRRAEARGDMPRVVGGVAVQEIEAWILALHGERRSEQHADAKAVLRARHAIADLDEKVAVIEGADLTQIPEDAASLHIWLKRARIVLIAQAP